ncbi:MAG: hypothetical protein R3B45_00310 [Bdellovibrionota bacterium]
MNRREPKLIVNMVLFANGKVLFVKYKNRPDHQKGWFIPHDLVPYNTHPEDIAISLVKNQLNLEISHPRIAYLESFRGNDRTWHLPISYVVNLNHIPKVSTSKDIEAIKWFDLNGLPDRSEVSHYGWALDILLRIKC